MRKTKMSDKGSKVWTAGIVVVCFTLVISALISAVFFTKPSELSLKKFFVNNKKTIFQR